MIDRRNLLISSMGLLSTKPARSYFAPNAMTQSPDPLIIAATVIANGSSVTAFTNTAGKSKISPPTSGRILTLISAGQSNCANTFTTAYTPTNTGHVFNFNVFDGYTYAAADPLLGCTRSGGSYGDGNYLGRLADKLINAGTCDNVVLVPLAVDASSVADWNVASLLLYFNTAHAWLTMRGLPPSAILWGQGETDNANSVGQTAYANSLASLITATRGFGLSCPWFVAQQTLYLNATSTAVRAAQAGAVNHSAGIWAGPDADTLTDSNRDQVIAPIGTHFTDTGSDLYAGLWQTALHAFGPPF